MKTFGLIGKSLQHSFSKQYFLEKFKQNNWKDVNYELFEIQELSDLNPLLQKNETICGLNVTIPYKESVIPFLDELDETAKMVGAVNCIKISRSKGVITLKGYNTDVFGFSSAIKPFLESGHQKALILGTGGASKAVYYVLSKLGIDSYFVSRTRKQTNTFLYSDLNEFMLDSFKLIVNTTPLGMYPNVSTCPELPYEYINSTHFVFDLVYNPEETLLLGKAKQQGALTQNGLSMLRLQAEKGWEIWNS